MVEEIEDNPEYYEILNRDAIVVKPKKPLFDWANSLTPDVSKTSISLRILQKQLILKQIT